MLPFGIALGTPVNIKKISLDCMFVYVINNNVVLVEEFPLCYPICQEGSPNWKDFGPSKSYMYSMKQLCNSLTV